MGERQFAANLRPPPRWETTPPPCRGSTPKFAEWCAKNVAKMGADKSVFFSSDHDKASINEYYAVMAYAVMAYAVTTVGAARRRRWHNLLVCCRRVNATKKPSSLRRSQWWLSPTRRSSSRSGLRLPGRAQRGPLPLRRAQGERWGRRQQPVPWLHRTGFHRHPQQDQDVGRLGHTGKHYVFLKHIFFESTLRSFVVCNRRKYKTKVLDRERYI